MVTKYAQKAAGKTLVDKRKAHIKKESSNNELLYTRKNYKLQK